MRKLPERQVEGDSGEITGFHHTKKDAANNQSSKVGYNTHKSHDLLLTSDGGKGYNSPTEHDGREEERRTEFSEGEIGRDFKNNVSTC